MKKHSTIVEPASAPWWYVWCSDCPWDDFAVTKHLAKAKGKAHEEETQ